MFLRRAFGTVTGRVASLSPPPPIVCILRPHVKNGSLPLLDPYLPLRRGGWLLLMMSPSLLTLEQILISMNVLVCMRPRISKRTFGMTEEKYICPNTHLELRGPIASGGVLRSLGAMPRGIVGVCVGSPLILPNRSVQIPA